MLANVMKDYQFFYPLLNQLCGGNSSACKIFNAEGLLMSPDGGHLTREGAVEGAKRLSSTFMKIQNSVSK